MPPQTIVLRCLTHGVEPSDVAAALLARPASLAASDQQLAERGRRLTVPVPPSSGGGGNVCRARDVALVEVVECTPFVACLLSDPNIEYVVLPPRRVVDASASGAAASAESDNESDGEIGASPRAAAWRRRFRRQIVVAEVDADYADGGGGGESDDEESDELVPLVVLDDFDLSPTRGLRQTPRQLNRVTAVVNIDMLSALVAVLSFESSRDAVACARLAAAVTHSTSHATRAGSFVGHADWLVSETTLRQLRLRHHSLVDAFSHADEGLGQSQHSDASAAVSRRLSLAAGRRASMHLDALCKLLFSSASVKSARSAHDGDGQGGNDDFVVVFATAECFANTPRLQPHVNVESSNLSRTVGRCRIAAQLSALAAGFVRFCSVFPHLASAIPTAPSATTVDRFCGSGDGDGADICAARIVLRPLTRSGVTGAADTASLLRSFRAAEVLPAGESRRPRRRIVAGTIIAVPRACSGPASVASAAPLRDSWAALAAPGAVSTTIATSPTDGFVWFVIEDVASDDAEARGATRDTARKRHRHGCYVGASTAVAEGSPICGAGRIPSVAPLNSATLTACAPTIDAVFATAAMRTETFRRVLRSVAGLLSSGTDAFHFVVVCAGSAKVGAPHLVRGALSVAGLPYEVCDPTAVGIDVVAAMARIACCGAGAGDPRMGSASGVLVLAVGDTPLHEHSDVVQWLVASAKQHAPLRVVLVSETSDSAAAVAVLNTAATDLVDIAETALSESDRRCFLEHLVGACRSFVSRRGALSQFFDFAALADASAGLSLLELMQWVLDCMPPPPPPDATLDGQPSSSTVTAAAASTDAQSGRTQRTLDHDVLASSLDGFKKRHGHNVTSSKLHAVRWADIGGLEEQRAEIMTVLRPPAVVAGAKRRAGVLLFGPPGCGKTLLAKAVATECECNFLSVKGPELLNMYVGESEKNIRDVFRRAREAAPCIVFFDELDALAPARGAKGDSGGVMDRIVAQLLVELDGAVVEDEKKLVFVLGATNRPDLLDPSLLRPGRFDRMCYVGLAETKADQLAAVTALTRKFRLASDVHLQRLLADVPCVYTGADYYGLCADAMTASVSEAVAAMAAAAISVQDNTPTATAVSSEMPSVTLKHFQAALAALSPSVTAAELQRYQQLRAQFAVGGAGATRNASSP